MSLRHARQALEVRSPPFAVSTLIPPLIAFVNAFPCNGFPFGPMTAGNAAATEGLSLEVEAVRGFDDFEVEEGERLLEVLAEGSVVIRLNPTSI